MFRALLVTSPPAHPPRDRGHDIAVDQNTALVHEAALLNFLMAKLHYLDPDVIVGHGLHGFPIEVGPLLCSVLVLTLMYHGANCHHWDRYCCTGCITTRSKTGPNWAGSSEASCPFEEEVSERRVMLLLRELTVQCHHAHTCVHTHTHLHICIRTHIADSTCRGLFFCRLFRGGSRCVCWTPAM